jgi:phage-related protein
VAVTFYSPAAAGVAYFDNVSLAASTILISCANGGQIDSWPVITLTGIVVTPVLTNSDGDSITVNYTTVNADDTLTIDTRPNGDYRRSVYYRANGTGTRVFKPIASASKYIQLPTGTNNLTVTSGATANEVTVALSWYLYYGGLY